MTKQISIRLNDDLHKWLSNHVAEIKPETSINKYVNYLLEQERGKLELQVYRKTNDGQVSE